MRQVSFTHRVLIAGLSDSFQNNLVKVKSASNQVAHAILIYANSPGLSEKSCADLLVSNKGH